MQVDIVLLSYYLLFVIKHRAVYKIAKYPIRVVHFLSYILLLYTITILYTGSPELILPEQLKLLFHDKRETISDPVVLESLFKDTR